MKGYYEYERENDLKFNTVSPCCLIGAHFHSNIEVFLVKSGKYIITKNGATIEIGAGEIAVFDSYDVHSYDEKIEEQTENVVVIIPHFYLERFNEQRNNKRITNTIIKDNALFEKLYSFTTEWLMQKQDEHVNRASAEMFLSLLFKSLDFDNVEFAEGDAIRKILSYAHQNFRLGISANDIAKNLGYSGAYVSRMFHKYLKESIPEYLNDMRLDYVKKELSSSTDKKVSQIILDAGFKSIQSYYRNKARKGKNI